MSIRTVCPLIVFIFSGCSLLGGDDSRVEIRTDAESYTVLPETVVRLTVSNESDEPIFYICTGQIYLEELSGDQVQARWMIHGFEECLGPKPIDTDQKEVFDLTFDDKSALANVDGALFDDSVEYRMTIDLFWDLAFKRALSDEDRRSNRFRIVRNPIR